MFSECIGLTLPEMPFIVFKLNIALEKTEKEGDAKIIGPIFPHCPVVGETSHAKIASQAGGLNFAIF